MIRYRLKCAEDHEFEAWFADSASYDAQAQAHHIACPRCGSHEVAKAIMAPAVAARTREPEAVEPAVPAQTVEPQLMELLREVRDRMLAGTEDVGAKFPEEARKIHYGDAEARDIRGTASGEEAEALIEEGIEILALPPLPEDAN